MITQNIGITVNYLIERRTRGYGRLKKICCKIYRQVRARAIHELFGLILVSNVQRGDAAVHIVHANFIETSIQHHAL